MTSRELRKQRREQERKAKKLAYQQSRAAASVSETCGAGSPAGEPVARPALVPNPTSSTNSPPGSEWTRKDARKVRWGVLGACSRRHLLQQRADSRFILVHGN
jgi:hypothetical protein